MTAQSTGYSSNVLIAPGGITTAAFTVSNTDGAGYVTETDMNLAITVSITAATGKTAIPYISASLLDSSGNVIPGAVVNVTNGVGTITLNVTKAFLAGVASTLTYKIKLTWLPHSDDINYEGPSFGNAYTVNVTGTQS